MSIQEKAMLVRLTVHAWGSAKQDQQLTEEVCKQKKTTEDCVRVNKMLLPKEATRPITSMLSAARSYHNSVTLPYDDLGFRILPSAIYQEYNTKVGEFVDKVAGFARKLNRDMPTWKPQAKKMLQDAYDEADYPDDIASYYGIDLKFRPIPEGAALRVDLGGNGELSRLQRGIDADIERQIHESVKELWVRLRERVSQAAVGFKDGKVLFSCWVDNIKELVDILPKLNITDDKDLDAMNLEVRQSLATLDIEAIRDDKAVRQQAAGLAQKSLRKLDRAMRARKIDLDLE